MTEPNILNVSGAFDPNRETTVLQLLDGRYLRVDTRLLTVDSSYTPIAIQDQDNQVIPLLEEQLQIGRRTVETGKVRLQKTVAEFDQPLNELLAVRTYDIERTILNQPVEVAPPVRQEGDTTIYSLVEEQLILTKQLILREEVRLIRRDTERLDTQVVTLKREHLTVERESVPRTE